MTAFVILLMSAALLCTLVAGLLFAFAIVVMPGLAKLPDRDFIRGFQVIDRVIQDGHPLFLLVWLGSILALIAAATMSIWQDAGAVRLLAMLAAAVYLLGVQLPTAAINIPLNNELQRLDVETMTAAAHKIGRVTFERQWNRWNAIRTACAVLTSVLLLVALAAM